MRMKMSFMVLEIWSFGFGEVMEIFLREFIRILNELKLITFKSLSDLAPNHLRQPLIQNYLRQLYGTRPQANRGSFLS